MSSDSHASGWTRLEVVPAHELRCREAGLPTHPCAGILKIRPATYRQVPLARCDRHWADRLTRPPLEPLTPWDEMDRLELHPVDGLERAKTSTSPGVYAFYRFGGRTYIGKAGCLEDRLWNCHLRTTPSMTNSAFRRNVAEHLAIASAQAIKTRQYLPSSDDVARINAFIRSMELACIECATEPEAHALEARMKREYLPFLTKQ